MAQCSIGGCVRKYSDNSVMPGVIVTAHKKKLDDTYEDVGSAVTNAAGTYLIQFEADNITVTQVLALEPGYSTGCGDAFGTTTATLNFYLHKASSGGGSA